MSHPFTRVPRGARRVLIATALATVALPAAASQAAEVTASGTEIVVEDRSGRGVETNRILAERCPAGSCGSPTSAPSCPRPPRACR